MLAKYTVEYAASVGKDTPALRYDTDTPTACTEFLVELLERDFHIKTILHDGKALASKQADHFVKQAASMLAARHICRSLHIDAAEENYRFGYSA